MGNFLVYFDDQPQPISIDTETEQQAMIIAKNSFYKELNVSVKKVTLNKMASILGEKGGKKGGLSTSPDKLAAQARNSKKGGRNYEYIIFEVLTERIIGYMKTARKEESLQKVQEMCPEEKVKLVLISKCSDEQIREAKEKLIITPHCIII